MEVVAKEIASMLLSGDQAQVQIALDKIETRNCLEERDAVAAALVRSGAAEEITSSLLN